MKKTVNIIIFALLLLIFGSYMFTFQVRKDQVAFVETFGKRSEPIDKAGLHLRWPWPIQQVYTFDNRIHLKTTDYNQIITGQGSLIIQAYFGWRIKNPEVFMKKAKGNSADELRRNAESNLEREIEGAVSAVFGEEKNITSDLEAMDSIANSESGESEGENRHTFEKLEEKIFDQVKGRAEQYGMELRFVGILRVGISQESLVMVLDSMVTQWTNKAFTPVHAAGEKAKNIIRTATVEKEASLLKAQNEADGITSKASAKEAELFSKMEQKDARLAELLLKLSTMERVLKNEATLLLDENVPFLEPFRARFFNADGVIPIKPSPEPGGETVDEPGGEPRSEN